MTLPEQRTTYFRRNMLLEKLLAELNSDLQPSEQALIQSTPNSNSTPYPLILIMGPLRSGTTLFTQWLANTGLVAYPTNLLSRFYQAPIIGAKVQLLLTDPRFNFRDELGEFTQHAEYKSENGKTKGVLAPNEFWYFWRRFLAEPTRDVWSDEELRQTMDTRTMLAELNGMMNVFQKPFAAKGMLFNYNIPFLNSIFEKAIFVQIKRDERTNVMSILDARVRQLGSKEAWYSFKIPEYSQLKDLDPITQAAGQVRHINKATSTGMESVPESRKIVIQYEKLCEDPSHYYHQIREKLGHDALDYTGPERFIESRPPTGQLARSIEDALSSFN